MNTGRITQLSGPEPRDIKQPFSVDVLPRTVGGDPVTEVVRCPSDPWLSQIQSILPNTEDYFYLAGPMSGKPGFNFAEFDRIAGNLRNQDYTISSPAEYEHEHVREKLLAAEGTEDHDSVGPAWADCLARDVTVVAHQRCLGIIVIDGWEDSRGALLETHVCEALGKPIYLYTEQDDGFTLIEIDRTAALIEHDKVLDARRAIREYDTRWDALDTLGLINRRKMGL